MFNINTIQLSIAAGLDVRHGDLSHEITSSVTNPMSHYLPATTDLLPLRLALKKQ